MQVIQTIFQDEQELLKSVIKLHCKTNIQLDPMFFKGNFYKLIEKPKHVFDIQPLVKECKKADAKELPLETESIETMILDPPFLFEIRNRKNKNYGARTHGILRGFEELKKLYVGILDEAHRVLRHKGICIFKCQDFTDSKTTFTHCLVRDWAIQSGFYVKDLAILHLPRNKIANSKLKQRHFRKTHSYFWVLENIAFEQEKEN